MNYKNIILVVIDVVIIRDFEILLLCNSIEKECVKFVMNLSLICERIFYERELGCGYMNKNEDYFKMLDIVIEVFFVVENLLFFCEINI